ncbi:glycoside hydrolase family 25 protein [Saccharopolyspora gloriosae]|uniref:glycoside hydrolase family 25 protein n=1 Tax=Saccharopolyspora gloriosae TaxID=455344 RepID=UPI00387E3524
MASIPGIDVARYQGEPDWAAVRGAGFAFSYIKATEGVGYVSPTLDSQLNGARAAGLVTGLYHFARPDTNSPQAEAADFAGQLARTNSSGAGNLPPCLDMETEAADLGAWIKGFVDALRGHTGRNEVVVYASSSWFSDKLATDSWVDPGVFLWVAHYGQPPGQPGFLTDRVAIHQHASDGQVPGIGGTPTSTCRWWTCPCSRVAPPRRLHRPHRPRPRPTWCSRGTRSPVSARRSGWPGSPSRRPTASATRTSST